MEENYGMKINGRLERKGVVENVEGVNLKARKRKAE